MKQPKRVGVMLLNMGGPDSLASVRPFLKNIFSDRMIIRLPAQPLFARLISLTRSRKVKNRYRLIGGKSPILEQTLEQAGALEKALNEKRAPAATEFKCYVGMRYWHPYIDEAVKQAVSDECGQLVALPLFPQYSVATTGSCFAALDRSLSRLAPGLKVTKVESWAEEPGFVDAVAARVSQALKDIGAPPHEVEILFSAHGLPQRFVDDGDPYPQQLAATIKGVLHRLGSLNWRLTYQSRSGPVKWLEPHTDVTIVELAKAGCKHMLIVPISFVSDHIETLYEVEIMFRRLALDNGVEDFVCTPGLRADPALIAGLASLVIAAVSEGESSADERARGVFG